ncbi:MAG TPA: hypothetical protein PKD00_01945 [Burkholderiales bacterium]|nr:hypothetical protein [Burkholderiales bacterium]
MFKLEEIKIPNHTVIVKLKTKEDVSEENGLYVISNMIQLRVPNTDQIIHVPDPNIFIPFGEIVKTGNESNLKVGDKVFVADEVATVKINIDEANPYPHVMQYGFWADPQKKYKVQTDLVHIPETLISAWV